MERRKILTIWFLALGLSVCWGKVSEAADIGTAFTYQGRLIDANYPADGLYDFMFTLYDSNDACDLRAGPIEVNDLDVIDGYFTAELDFGEVFDGNDLWLKIAVRPGESDDATDYTFLDPLVELTPAPHAIYARIAGRDGDWMVSDSNMYSIPSGNVGIGTDSPGAKLDVSGSGIIVVRGTDTSAGIGVWGQSAGSIGVFGLHTDSGCCGALGSSGVGAYGIDPCSGNVGQLGAPLFGVFGSSDTSYGVFGSSNTECGVYGIHTGSLCHGVLGANDVGVVGTNGASGNVGKLGAAGFAVYGESASGVGVYGKSGDTGIHGVYGEYAGSLGAGVTGFNTASYCGGLLGTSDAGVLGTDPCSGNYGKLGTSTYGVYGESSSGVAGHFSSSSGYGLIVDSGNAGIGTDTPATKLHVHQAGAAQLRLSSDASEYVDFYKGGAGLAVSINGSEKVRLSDDGDVGIGVTDPTEDLDVAGTARLRSIPSDTGTTVHVLGDGTLVKFVSSRRYKRNIEELEVKADAVLKLQPVSFQYKSSGHQDIGLIAEEVAEHLPDLVIYDQAGQPDAVKYDRVAVYLLQVVKSQQERIAALEETVQGLQTKMQQAQFVDVK